MEKAYAKCYGDYITIEGGDPGHALKDLTGAPYEYMEDWTKLDTEKLWKFIYNAESRGWLICCLINGEEDIREE